MKWERNSGNFKWTSISEKQTNGRRGSAIKARLYGVSDANSYESAMQIALCFVVFCALCILSMLWSGSVEAAETGKASWYSQETCKFNKDPKCPTASGKSLYTLEKEGVLYAASYRYALGQRVAVTNQETGKRVVVTILDRGPARRLNRVIDLGKRAFEQIGDTRKGLISVRTEAV